MFKSIIDKIKRRQNVPLNSTPDEDFSNDSPEREEDGFVLLGETLIERNTVLPDTSVHSSDSPPSYRDSVINNNYSNWTQNMGQQPSNQNVVKQTGTIDSPPDYRSNSSASSSGSINNNKPTTPNRRQTFTEISLEQSHGSNSSDTTGAMESSCQTSHSCPKSPVSDVPFQLGEVQRLAYELSQQNTQGLNRIPHIDMRSYSYDFNLERSVLRDFDNNANDNTP